MFNWFKNKNTGIQNNEKIENPIEIEIAGINPQTENEFLFYDFVENEFTPHLEKWYKKAKSEGITFKVQFENAILEKVRNNFFKNPYSFDQYFNNTFDFIAIDFETANSNRISACAVGIIFIKNSKVAFSKKFYIKPPKGENFNTQHISIHGITKEDVVNSLNFSELWESELNKYFNNNLIVYHNASMDLSILKNLFQYYSIKDFSIKHIDTMRIAEKSFNPKKLSDLAQKFEISFSNNHEPEEDARVCAYVFGELTEIYPDYKNLIGILDYSEIEQKSEASQNLVQINNENLNVLKTYSLTKEEIEKIEINNKSFIITGELNIDRNTAHEIIIKHGGVLKSSVTSKVDYVIAGIDFGWAKIQKVDELNKNKNCKIKILTNSDFEKVAERYVR